MSKRLCGLFIAVFLFNISEVLGQGETAVPFLMIPNSVEGNGMGGIAASLVSDDAISTISNPDNSEFSAWIIFSMPAPTPQRRHGCRA